MEADAIEELLRKIEICDKALTNLASSDADAATPIERAIRDVRADAIVRLRALGHSTASDER